jgi:hypothetical protein
VEPVAASADAPEQAGQRWSRAGARWNGTNRGLAARILVIRPRVAPGEHALVELSAQLGASPPHAAELGLRVSPTDHGDPDPHLFVFAWAAGRRTCYDGCGWADASTDLRPGDSLGSRVGTEVTLGLVLVDGAWWAWMDDRWLGAFSPEIWSSAFTEADGLQWFGEVYTNDPPARSEMGTGVGASVPGAATIRGLCRVPWDRWVCEEERSVAPFADGPSRYGAVRWPDGSLTYGGPGAAPDSLRPRPPPSSASGGTPGATGR